MTESKNEEIKKSQTKEKYWIGILVAFTIFQWWVNVFAWLLYILGKFFLNLLFLDGYVDEGYIGNIELGIAWYFAWEMIGNFYFHPKPKYRFFFSFDTWIDFCTILPELIPIIIRSGSNNSVAFLRILRVFKIMRIVKFRKTFKKIQLGKKQKELELNVESISRLKKQLIMLVISLFATLFISAGIITFVEETFHNSMSEELKFADSFYFIVITATTIGYGDIYPISRDSRIIISFLIVFIFAIFGDQISKIIAIMKESDRYDIAYNLKNHTVIFNNKSTLVLTSFLLDHLSHWGIDDTKILVVDEVSMTDNMSKLIHFGYFEGRVHFLSVRKGITPKTLLKACVKSANNIFIISDPYSSNGEEQDKRGLFLKIFLRNNGVDWPIFLQMSLYDEKYLENYLEKYPAQELQEE